MEKLAEKSKLADGDRQKKLPSGHWLSTNPQEVAAGGVVEYLTLNEVLFNFKINYFLFRSPQIYMLKYF